MYSHKSVFALLLASGVSRSAWVPTDWEIVVDLVRKLATLKGPALLLTFAAGMAALGAKKLTALKIFLTEPTLQQFGKSEPLIFELPVGSVSSRTNPSARLALSLPQSERDQIISFPMERKPCRFRREAH